jgi:predicted dehydrogenase
MVESRVARVAVIGLGGVAESHLEAYAGSDRVSVVAAAELRADRLRDVSQRYGIRPYLDYRQMLAEESPDIACVLTPCSTHESIVVDCAQGGVNVLCEKPLALSLAAAQRMIESCRQAGVQLFYGSSYRYLPGVVEARRLVAAGAVGEVLLLREQNIGGVGRKNQRALSPAHYPSGGPGGSSMGLVDHGIHLLDVLPWIAGSRVTSVFGRGNISGAPLGTEFAVMQLANGAICELVYEDGTFGVELPAEGVFGRGGGWDAAGERVAPGTWQGNPGCISVHGSKGALRVYHYANVLYLFDESGAREIPLTGRPMPGHFATQIEAFADGLQAGDGPQTPAEAGLEALGILLAVYESACTGAAVAR